MKTRLILVLATLTACDSGNGPPLPQASSLHVLHAIRGGPSLTVSVDGARGSTLVFGGQSRTFLSPGLHERSEEHTSELQSRLHLVCRLLLEKKKHQLHLNISHLRALSRPRLSRERKLPN